MVETRSKKRVSKKLKSSWRKHVNITDVEEFLEEKRLEERLGPPLATVPNEALFKVDAKPSVEFLSARQRRKLAVSKPLRCFSALQPYTNVPDPISKRNRVRTKQERVSDLIKKKEILNASKGIVKAKARQAKLNRELDNLRRKSQLKRGEYDVDLWDGDGKGETEEWVEKNTKKHNLRGVSVAVKSNINLKKEKGMLPAIELPHPGMSYNPSYEDHQDLLRKVADKETKLIKEDKHLTRVTKGMFSKVTEERRDNDWLVDMSEGLPSKNNIGDKEEGDASDGEYKSVNPPVKNSKKTLKQKRKKREHLEMEKARKAVKLQKKKITDLHNLKTLVKEIDVVDKKQGVLRDIKKKNKELKKNDTKVLNAMKYEEPDLEFNLGQEIAGNLKDLKTEGNLLMDRFKSMQKRNILAPTKRHVIKKPKVKKYTKPGHKDENWKKTVARSGLA